MLNLPTPPTDNLYKFISIFGLVLAILGVFYTETKSLELSQEIYSLEREKNVFNIEKSKIERKRNYLKDKIDDFNSRADIKSKPIVNDSVISWTRIISGSKELMSESNNISTLIEELREVEIEIEKKQVEINSKESIIELKINQDEKIFEIIDVLIPIGVILSFFGFVLWYDKSQKFQDEILKEQFLQVQKDKNCQSCGIILSSDVKYTNTTEEEKKRIKYCSNCYSNEQFIEPNLTYYEMRDKIKSRLQELGANKVQIFFYLTRIKSLDRWRKKFTWK
jgi:hypothetical protein